MNAGDRVSHFRIVEKIGGGGMGVVYSAEDTRLGRTVALKFLPPHLSGDDDARARFIGEAQAASALNHPSICTILDVGQGDDGQMWIAMPRYDGESLRQALSRGPLGVEDALKLGAEVAAALARAHEAGVLHRDIKPGNIQITADGRPVVLDFGLAKLAGAADLTVTGSLVGTVAYMSPEQVRGESLGPESDIWSLAVVLYEALTGVKPFGADYEQAIIYSILNVEPKALSALKPGLPIEADAAVARALRKDRSVRFATMSEFVGALSGDGSPVPTSGGPPAATAVAGTGVMASGLASSTGLRSSEERSIAVLPFSDMSPARDQEYFCQGVAEEILGALSRVPGLRTASRMSTARFAEGASDIREIGATLGVSSVLEGSVRKAGNRLRVSVQLIDVADGYQKWSERFDRELDDIFAIQDEIALSVAVSLEIALTPADEEEVQFRATADAEAYDLCLKGWRQFHRFSRKNTMLAMGFFEQATQLDERYVRAWAGLAICHGYMHMFFDATGGHDAESDRLSRKAADMDPASSEARASRGIALSVQAAYDAAEAELREAIRLDPDLFEGWWLMARLYTGQGKMHEAAVHFARASELRPEHYQTLIAAAICFRATGDAESAHAFDTRGVQAAEKHLSENPEDTRALYYGASAWLNLGEMEKGRQWVERALDLEPEEGPVLYNAACFFAKAGETERALELLEATYSVRSVANQDWLVNDPDFDSIKDHPRFQAIVDRLAREARQRSPG